MKLDSIKFPKQKSVRGGWFLSYILVLIVPLLAIPLRGNSSSGRISEAQYKQSMGEALREALGHARRRAVQRCDRRKRAVLVIGMFIERRDVNALDSGNGL